MELLDRLTALEKEAAQFGFKWERAEQIKQQIQSEIAEVDVHLQDKDTAKLQEELGDLIHAVFSLTIFCGFDAKITLQNSINKFEQRFNAVKKVAAERGLGSLNGQSFEELMAIWDQVKREERDD